MTDLLENPFWQYSLNCYAREGVERLCLRLQNQYGVNVNVLLWACWSAEQGVALEQVRLLQALRLIAPCQCDYVEPLRAMRNALTSPMQQALRKKILAAELEAEKVVQHTLYEYFVEQYREGGGNQIAGLSENLSCVLDYYEAEAELPQGLAVLS